MIFIKMICLLCIDWFHSSILVVKNKKGLPFLTFQTGIPGNTCYWPSRIEFQKVPFTDSDWIPKGTYYWLSWIEFQKVPATDYLGLNSKRYLSLTISDWVLKGTIYWLSWIEFQTVHITDYLGLNTKKYKCYLLSRYEFQKVPVTDYIRLSFKRYHLLTILAWIPKDTYYHYLGLNSERYLLLTITDWITKGTCYWLYWFEFQRVRHVNQNKTKTLLRYKYTNKNKCV